jgi:hypothetical protein
MEGIGIITPLFVLIIPMTMLFFLLISDPAAGTAKSAAFRSGDSDLLFFLP